MVLRRAPELFSEGIHRLFPQGAAFSFLDTKPTSAPHLGDLSDAVVNETPWAVCPQK